MKICVVAILASFSEFVSAQPEEKKYNATTIVEPPYLMTKKANPTENKDFEGYIPDLLQKMKDVPGCNCTFKLKLVRDGKYGVPIDDATSWNGMIGEVTRGEANLIAAPITMSEKREKFLEFAEHFMTFDTVVLMKRTSSVERVNTPIELYERADIEYGLVKDGFTESFFKKSDKEFYLAMYNKSDKTKFPTTSRDGVRKVQSSDGKYAFMIDSSTADYWVNKKPCDLYSFRLGSHLDCHKYAFAVKKDSLQNLAQYSLLSRLEAGLRHLKSTGELERLKAKWWPHECSAATAAFSIMQLNVLQVVLAIIVAHRLI